ncbi:MAG: hypothetical protein Kow00127_03500 [Bacteroidales bacterium]
MGNLRDIIGGKGRNPGKFWLPLDNAAKIFPAIRTEEHSTVIRITAVLKERVVLKHLMEAVSLAAERFPFYRVTLHQGFFWYYLEQSDAPFTIVPDTCRPCKAFSKNDSPPHLIRVMVAKNRISVEVSHILTDGHGVSRFLIWITEKYFMLKNSTPVNRDEIKITPEQFAAETEDAYSKYFKNRIPYTPRLAKAFHLPFALSDKPRFDVLIALIGMEQLKAKAREKGISVTGYLIAVHLFVLQEIASRSRNRHKRVIRIQVPVNLRNIYPSDTMRNFSLFVLPEIDPRLGKWTFDEILKTVFHKMQLETDEKLISKIISRNVGSEKKWFVRGIPLFIKNIVLRYKYYTEGADQYSGVVTNLGKIEVPETIRNRIDYFVVTPPPPNRKLKVNCGIAGFGNQLAISFGNITRSKELEQAFLKFLTGEGIHVRIRKISDL